MISIVLFALLLLVGFGFFTKNALQIRSNILLGRDIDRSDRSSDRWKTMLLVAFGQKKMFSRPLPALLHLAIYAAFVVTQIELIEIFVDGLTDIFGQFNQEAQVMDRQQTLTQAFIAPDQVTQIRP